MNYYVYTLARPDDTVFYVGKGSGNRVAQHEKEALRGHHCPKCDLIRSIWRDGGVIQRAIVFETEDHRAALDREAALIRQYGPAQLVNRTFGGQTGPRPRRRNKVADELSAQLVDQLFKRYRRPDGKEYTYGRCSARKRLRRPWCGFILNHLEVRITPSP